MLSINHVDSFGVQTIREAFAVEFLPEEALLSSSGEKLTHGVIVAMCPSSNGLEYENERVRMYEGRVFVMNTHGSTIAKYELSDEMSADKLKELRRVTACLSTEPQPEAAQRI